VQYNKVRQEVTAERVAGMGRQRFWDDAVLGVCSNPCVQASVTAELGVDS